MTSRNVSNAAYDDLSNLMLEAEVEYVDTDMLNTKLALRLCQSQSAFQNGYKQYCELAHQWYMNPLQPPSPTSPCQGETTWYTDVVEGLTKLGPVRSVTLDNSFGKHHHVGMDALDDVDLYGSAQPHTGRPYFEQQEKCVSTHSTVGLVEATPHGYYKNKYAIVRSGGTRPVGSPLGRSWPPQLLQPLISNSPALAYSDWDQELLQVLKGILNSELSTGADTLIYIIYRWLVPRTYLIR